MRLKCILQGLFRSTLLHHIWRAQIRTSNTVFGTFRRFRRIFGRWSECYYGVNSQVSNLGASWSHLLEAPLAICFECIMLWGLPWRAITLLYCNFNFTYFCKVTRNQRYTSGMWSSLSLALSSSTWVNEVCVGSLQILADSANFDPIPSVGVDTAVWDSLASHTLLWNILPPTLISWHQHQHQHQQHPD